jgi:hypothetical protein
MQLPWEKWIDQSIQNGIDAANGWPIPEPMKDAWRKLLPILQGKSVFPFPLSGQHTSWQFFTGEVDSQSSVLGEIASIIGVTLADDKGHFFVQSSKHPQDLYRCDFKMGVGGFAFGIPIGRIVKWLSKAIKLLKHAPKMKKAADALRNALVHIEKVRRKLAKGKDAELALKIANKVLDGWLHGEVPLQNIRRSLLNLQNEEVELGPPTGLYGKVIAIVPGISLGGKAQLVFLFMGDHAFSDLSGPLKSVADAVFGWNPFAYRYMGAYAAFGLNLAAEVELLIKFGDMIQIKEVKTGKVIQRPR